MLKPCRRPVALLMKRRLRKRAQVKRANLTAAVSRHPAPPKRFRAKTVLPVGGHPKLKPLLKKPLNVQVTLQVTLKIGMVPPANNIVMRQSHAHTHVPTSHSVTHISHAPCNTHSRVVHGPFHPILGSLPPASVLLSVSHAVLLIARTGAVPYG